MGGRSALARALLLDRDVLHDGRHGTRVGAAGLARGGPGLHGPADGRVRRPIRCWSAGRRAPEPDPCRWSAGRPGGSRCGAWSGSPPWASRAGRAGLDGLERPRGSRGSAGVSTGSTGVGSGAASRGSRRLDRRGFRLAVGGRGFRLGVLRRVSPASSFASSAWRAIAATSFGEGGPDLPFAVPVAVAVAVRRCRRWTNRRGRGHPGCGGRWYRPGASRPRSSSARRVRRGRPRPRPWQCSQFSLNASSRPVPIRLRVICTRPSEVTSATWWRVRSRPRHSTRRRSTRSRLDSRTMSMKSTTMMPPMSRSRSWRTISSAASRLFLVTVSSRLPPEPVNLPVLTSTTVIASVRSMISEPPEGSQTLRSRPLAICSSIRYAAKTSALPFSAAVVALETLLEVGRDVGDVALDGVPGVVALDDELGEVLGEEVADDLEGQVRLAVQELRGVALGLLLDVLPARLEPLDVAGQLVLAGALGRGPHDDAGGVRDDLLEERLEAVALGVGELAGDAAGGAVRHVDEEPAGQADLAGQPGALVPDRVLGDLDQDGLAGGQHRLDLAGLAVLVAERGPVDLAGVQHRVAALADVDERRLHGGQHVLDAAEVDVADQRGLGLAGDVVLDEDLVLEDARSG